MLSFFSFKTVAISIVIQCFFTSLYSAYVSPKTVVIITGTSSSGKTSIMKHIKEYLDETCWQFLAADNFIDIDEEKDEECKEIDNYETYELAPENIALVENIADWTRNGINVVCDVVLDDSIEHEVFLTKLNTLDNIRIIAILIYAPLIQLLHNVENRNSLGDEKEQRLLSNVVAQFGSIYTQSPPSSPPIARITRTEIHTICKSTLMSDGSEREEFRLKHDLSFPHNEEVEEITIIPRQTYDLIVTNDGTKTLKSLAQEIAQFILERC